jgi:hypothetical protein
MQTSQAFRTAIQIPLADPTAGQVVVTSSSGDQYATTWQSSSAGTPLPVPNAQGQVLMSGVGPGYAWTASDILDAGVY